ncbi:MAG: hypothetical protein ACRD3B_15725 [Candidatus Sulfotelmatobacter sp.]
MQWLYRVPASLWCVVLSLALAVRAHAQMPLNADEARKATSLFEAVNATPLKCKIQPWQPTLDFSFRFVAGYAVYCRLGLFEGKKATLTTYVRVTPAGKPSVMLGAANDIPAIAPEMLRFAGGDASKIKNEVGSSNIFAVGGGSYSIEVAATDDRGRVCLRRWKIRVEPDRSQRKLALAVAPLGVQALDRNAWQIDSARERGDLRFTILLNAAPINPYQSTLRAWDRTFLLECLYTLLRQIPYKSVRLIAFNLDQQREIYRSNRFDDDAFLALSHALRRIETSTVSVQALRQRNSPKFLLSETNSEISESDHAQALVYLSPALRSDVQAGADLLAGEASTRPPFFYFEYVPGPQSAFPDSIQHLVTAANGKTFQIHSPSQLNQAIQKMLAQLKKQ